MTKKSKLILWCVLMMGVGAAAAQNPSALDLNNEGVECLSRGEIQAAIDKLETARRMDPKNAALSKNLACAYARKAEELTGRGELKEAVHWLDEALSVGSKDEMVRNNIAAGYNNVADVHMRAQRYGEAISLLQTAVSLQPDGVVLRSNLGVALYGDNQRSQALDEFRGVVAIDPNNALARKMCGLLLYWKGQTKEALEELREAAKLNPSDKEVDETLKKIEREYAVEKEFDSDSQVHFNVSFDSKKDYRLGKAVIDGLESAWSKVGADLNFYPSEKIAVVVYTGRQFHELLNKAKFVGGVYDGKIRVPVGGLDTERDQEQLKTVLMHEYAHAAIHFLTHNRCPLWLHEGIAEYVSEAWDKNKEQQITSARDTGQLIPLKDLPSALKSTSSEKAGLAYCEALSITKLIADHYGVYTLRKILDNLDSGDDIDKALSKAISLDQEGLEKEWLKSLGVE